jgi:hypothetical protein
MKKTAPATYTVNSSEGLAIGITCTGTAYQAFGSLGRFVLEFSEGSPQTTITPGMLDGPGSNNRIHLHVVYGEESTPTAEYMIEVLDDNGQTVETLGSRRNMSRALPYRNDFTLVVTVGA